MRILVAISSFGLVNRPHLERCLRSWDAMTGYEVEVILFLTVPLQLGPMRIGMRQVMFPEDVGPYLTTYHKKVLSEEHWGYDLICYVEDDILITEGNVDCFVELSGVLAGTHFVPGFLRFESPSPTAEDDQRFLLDLHPMHSYHRGGSGVLKDHHILAGGEAFFDPWNIHQGCYLFTRSQFRRVLDSGRYLDGPRYAGIIEGSNSDVYLDCGVRRIVSASRLHDCLVEHLSRKYITTDPARYNPAQCPTVRSLLFDLERAEPTVVERGFREACATPGDRTEHLPALRQYATGLAAVTERGVRGLASTWALLAARPGRLTSYGSADGPVALVCEAAARCGVDLRFAPANDANLRIDQTDLLFIDNCGTKEHLSRELAMNGPRVSKWIILHDTDADAHGNRCDEAATAGLSPAVGEFVAREGCWRSRERRSDHGGLTVLERIEKTFP